MARTEAESDAEALEGFGRVIRSWAYLESSLWGWVGFLMGTDEWRSRIIWASISNCRARLTFLLRLGETFLDGESLPQFRALWKRTKALSAHRNMIAHDNWLTSDKAHKLAFHADKDAESGDFDFGHFKSIDRTNLVQWRDEGMNLHREWLDLMMKANVHTWPRMLRGQPGHPSRDTDLLYRPSRAEPPPPPPPSRE